MGKLQFIIPSFFLYQDDDVGLVSFLWFLMRLTLHSFEIIHLQIMVLPLMCIVQIISVTLWRPELNDVMARKALQDRHCKRSLFKGLIVLFSCRTGHWDIGLLLIEMWLIFLCHESLCNSYTLDHYMKWTCLVKFGTLCSAGQTRSFLWTC